MLPAQQGRPAGRPSPSSPRVKTSQVGRCGRGRKSIIIRRRAELPGSHHRNTQAMTASWTPSWSAILGTERPLASLRAPGRRGSLAELRQRRSLVSSAAMFTHTTHALSPPASVCAKRKALAGSGCASARLLSACPRASQEKATSASYRLQRRTQERNKAAHSPDCLVSDSSVSDGKKNKKQKAF